MNLIIERENHSKIIGNGTIKAVDNLNLKVIEGETLGLLDPILAWREKNFKI